MTGGLKMVNLGDYVYVERGGEKEGYKGFEVLWYSITSSGSTPLNLKGLEI